MTPETHKRYLDYRAQYEYFGRHLKMLTAAEFEAADIEQLALDAKGEDARDDEEEIRFNELNRMLFRD